MTTGWVIAVEDLRAKDRAFKIINKSRQETSEKVNKLKARYDSIEEGRFSVSIASPHTEIDVENRIKIRCKKTEHCSSRLLFSYLHDLNPFCYKQTEESTFMEIDVNAGLNDALANIEYDVV